MPVNSVIAEAIMEKLLKEISMRVEYVTANHTLRTVTIKFRDADTYKIVYSIFRKAGKVIENA